VLNALPVIISGFNTMPQIRWRAASAPFSHAEQDEMRGSLRAAASQQPRAGYGFGAIASRLLLSRRHALKDYVI
jgi:hypothetical protein